MEPLTRRQQDVLHYIADVQAAKKVSPKLIEIATAFGIQIGSVQYHIKALRRKGYLDVTPHARRGIFLTRSKREWKAQRSWRSDFERRVGEKLAGAADLGRVFEVVERDLRGWLEADRLDLFVHDTQHRVLRGREFHAAAGSGVAGGGEAAPGADVVSEAAARRRRPVVEGAVAAVPIPGRDRALGVLRLESTKPGAPPPDEAMLARATMAAAALAPVLEQAAAGTELARRIRLQSALVGLVRTVHSARDFQEILRSVRDVVQGLVKAPVFTIYMKDQDAQWWVLYETDLKDGKPWEDAIPDRVMLGNNEAIRTIQEHPWYIKHRTPEEIRELESKPPGPGADGMIPTGNVAKRSRSFLYVPIRSERDLAGYLSVQSYDYNAYSVRDAEDLGLIAEYIGLAVQNAWRREKEQAARRAAEKVLAKTDDLEASLKKLATDPEGPERTKRLIALAKEVFFLRPGRVDPIAALKRGNR